MSIPNKNNGAACEIISAMSALNMMPHENDPKELDADEYISDQLFWVKHAMEHLNTALSCINTGQF